MHACMVALNHSKRRRVAIIGSGPAGTTLACLLARNGIDAVIFEDEKRPEMVVGESLVPKLVPVFRRLGIEDKVKTIGTHKPGVTWTLNEGDSLQLSFTALQGVLPTYAYNVSRREFDQIVNDAAVESGARFVKCSAKLEAVEGKNGEGLVPRLSAETLALVPDWNGEHPELLVDASGRRRIFAKLLGIKAAVGQRKDVSHFAHYDHCEFSNPVGQTMIYRLKHGWGWRIPLVNKMSIGVVINKEHLHQYGANAEEQLEAIIDQNPVLAKVSSQRKRLTNVTTYANYQLISDQGHGTGWVSVGDAFGFVDPMLSPGLTMAMTSAEKLADVILNNTSADAQQREFSKYIGWFRKQLTDWQTLIDYFYDGRIFALYKTGDMLSKRYPGKFSNFMEKHMYRVIACMAGGGRTSHPYNCNVLKLMTRFGIKDHLPSDYAVK